MLADFFTKLLQGTILKNAKHHKKFAQHQKFDVAHRSLSRKNVNDDTEEAKTRKWMYVQTARTIEQKNLLQTTKQAGFEKQYQK